MINNSMLWTSVFCKQMWHKKTQCVHRTGKDAHILFKMFLKSEGFCGSDFQRMLSLVSACLQVHVQNERVQNVLFSAAITVKHRANYVWNIDSLYLHPFSLRYVNIPISLISLNWSSFTWWFNHCFFVSWDLRLSFRNFCSSHWTKLVSVCILWCCSQGYSWYPHCELPGGMR